jgi:hypothetical protein
LIFNWPLKETDDHKENEMSEKSIRGFSITLSVISLCADLIAISQLVIQIVYENKITDITWQLIGVVLIFLLGVGLGMIGIRGHKTDRIENILKLFIWLYLILACLTYAGIIIRFRQPFSLSSYVPYFIVLAIQLSAFSVLRAVSEVKDSISYSFAFLTMAVIHGLVWLTHLVFINNEEPTQIVLEWLFWFAWTLFAIPIIIKGIKTKTKKASFIQE